jgi:hypothetical protein
MLSKAITNTTFCVDRDTEISSCSKSGTVVLAHARRGTADRLPLEATTSNSPANELNPSQATEYALNLY